MGCHSSKAACADGPREVEKFDGLAAKGTDSAAPSDSTQIPSSASGADGSEASTDDASSSLQMSGETSMESSECFKDAPSDPMCQGLDLPADLELFLEVAAGDIDFVAGNSTFPSSQSSATISRADLTLSGQVSCMHGTTPRDRSRRVSFNEAGPEIVHVEPLEVNGTVGTLRRANNIYALTMDIDPSDDSEMEAVLRMHAAEHGTPPWSGLTESATVHNPDSPVHSLPPRCAPSFSRFGWCCVARGDGSLPSHGELEYDLCEESEGGGAFLPYVTQVPMQVPRALTCSSEVSKQAVSRSVRTGACL